MPALYPDGAPVFSLWQQGAGRVDASGAVYGDYQGAANQGLDVAADLAGTQHYAGYTRWDEGTQQFYLVSPDGCWPSARRQPAEMPCSVRLRADRAARLTGRHRTAV